MRQLLLRLYKNHMQILFKIFMNKLIYIYIYINSCITNTIISNQESKFNINLIVFVIDNN